MANAPFVQIDGWVMWMDSYVLQSRFSPNSYSGHLWTLNAVVKTYRNPFFRIQNLRFCFKIIKLINIQRFMVGIYLEIIYMALLIRTQILLFFLDPLTWPLGRHRVHASWMYMAKLAAAKEFAYMKALKDPSGLGKKWWFRRNCMKLCVKESHLRSCLLACCVFTIYI